LFPHPHRIGPRGTQDSTATDWLLRARNLSEVPREAIQTSLEKSLPSPFKGGTLLLVALGEREGSACRRTSIDRHDET